MTKKEISLNYSKISVMLERLLHYENTPMQYTAIFHGLKNGNYQMKNCDTFLIFAKKNIDRMCTLELLQ